MATQAATCQAVWEGKYDDEGRPHGEGTMTYTYTSPENEEEEEEVDSPVETYKGQMLHGQREGRGIYTWSNGATYEGEYKDNQRTGKGVLLLPDKGQYEGQFLNNKPHGEGTYTYPNNDVYQGQWANGVKHGQGMFYFKSQECQYVGTWQQGSFSEGTWVHQDGSTFRGKFEQSLPVDGSFRFPRSQLAQSGVWKVEQWDGQEPFAMAQ